MILGHPAGRDLAVGHSHQQLYGDVSTAGRVEADRTLLQDEYFVVLDSRAPEVLQQLWLVGLADQLLFTVVHHRLEDCEHSTPLITSRGCVKRLPDVRA